MQSFCTSHAWGGGGRETASSASVQLSTSTTFHKPWKQFCLPKELLLLALLYFLGKESAENMAPISVAATTDGCHSWPLQAQKLPLAATAAASSDGGGDSLCMLPKHPLLLSSLTTRAGGLQPVTTT